MKRLQIFKLEIIKFYRKTAFVMNVPILHSWPKITDLKINFKDLNINHHLNKYRKFKFVQNKILYNG